MIVVGISSFLIMTSPECCKLHRFDPALEIILREYADYVNAADEKVKKYERQVQTAHEAWSKLQIMNRENRVTITILHEQVDDQIAEIAELRQALLEERLEKRDLRETLIELRRRISAAADTFTPPSSSQTTSPEPPPRRRRRVRMQRPTPGSFRQTLTFSDTDTDTIE